MNVSEGVEEKNKIGIARTVDPTPVSAIAGKLWNLHRTHSLSAFLILSLCCPLACSDPGTLNFSIAAAANTQPVMEELIDAFQSKEGIPCDLIIGSSGQLTAQIIQGGPYDLFFSADLRYPDRLTEEGLVDGAPITYALGYLVLWSLRMDKTASIESLTHTDVKHIAIANPQTAPYGRAALQVLEHFSLLPSIQEKLVYGESISQTNQFIMSQAADVGFTAKSVILSDRIKGKGSWMELPKESYTSIAQGLVILRNGHHRQTAGAFVSFVASDEGTSILRKYGYDAPSSGEQNFN